MEISPEDLLHECSSAGQISLQILLVPVIIETYSVVFSRYWVCYFVRIFFYLSLPYPLKNIGKCNPHLC